MHFSYQAASLRICVDGQAFSGRIAGQRLHSAIAFSDINDFLSRVDAVLDSQQFPRAFQRLRSFTDKEQPDVPAVMSPEELQQAQAVEQLKGERATFLLLVRSRQNADWQGHIDWLDGQPPQRFSSTLEFVKILCQRLEL